MIKLQILALALIVTAPVSADDVFIQQLSPGRAPVGLEQSPSGGAFVQQVPADARPATPQAAGPATAVRTFVRQVFINPKQAIERAASQNAALVVDEAPGITGYGDKAPPALPNVGAGSSVVLTLPGTQDVIPSVGRGVVAL